MSAGDKVIGYISIGGTLMSALFGFAAVTSFSIPVRILVVLLAAVALGPIVGSLHTPLRHSIELRFENEDLLRDLQAANEALLREVTTDALTKLRNRAGLDAALATADNIGIVYVDIDHFKSINDTFGHAAGDQVLQRLGDALARSTRQVDVVSRLGGDEFVVLIDNTSSELLVSIAERIRDDIRAEFADENITVSIGAANGNDEHRAPADIMQRADAQLYKAKRTGRDKMCVAA
jgi:diguanylate cyclase (GGDEF)-like protein